MFYNLWGQMFYYITTHFECSRIFFCKIGAIGMDAVTVEART